MSPTLQALLALALPMFFATLCLRRLAPADAISTSIASGILVGLALAALIARLSLGSSYGLWFALLLVLIATIFLLVKGGLALGGRGPWLVMAALLLLWLLRSWPALQDLFWQPIHAWDAYNVWTLRAKVWFGAGEWVEFAREPQYIAAIAGSVHFSAAAHYPLLVSLIQLYSASAAGVWEDNLALLPWLFFLPALILALDGLLARAQVKPIVRLALGWVMLSLPLMQAHIAHAGYADTLLCLALLVALSHWLLYLNGRSRSELLLALFFTAMLPLIKWDGWLWISCLAAALALLYAPPRLLLVCWLLLIVGVTLLVLGYGFSMKLGPFGVFELSHEGIQLPGMTRYTLGFRDSSAALVETLFLQPSWNLLFWVAPFLSLLALGRWRRAPGTRLLLVFLGFGALAFLMLFLFTSAAEFAETATASNRLLMPLVTVFIALFGLSFAKDATSEK